GGRGGEDPSGGGARRPRQRPLGLEAGGAPARVARPLARRTPARRTRHDEGPMKLTIDGKPFEVNVGTGEVTVRDRTFRVRVEGRGPLKTVYVDEQPFRIEVPAETNADELKVLVDARYRTVQG